MAAQSGSDEGIRVLDDFVCEAKPGPDMAPVGSSGRGANAGMYVASSFVVRAEVPSLTQERQAALRNLSNSELLALVQGDGSELGSEELHFIHDLALERLAHGDNSCSQGAEELSRKVMQVAVRRIA